MSTSNLTALVAAFEACLHNTMTRYGGTVDEIVQKTKGTSYAHSFDGYCTCMTPWWVKDVYDFLTPHGIKPEPFFDFLAEREFFKKGTEFLNAKRLNRYSEDDKVKGDDAHCLYLFHLVILFSQWIEEQR